MTGAETIAEFVKHWTNEIKVDEDIVTKDDFNVEDPTRPSNVEIKDDVKTLHNGSLLSHFIW